MEAHEFRALHAFVRANHVRVRHATRYARSRVLELYRERRADRQADARRRARERAKRRERRRGGVRPHARKHGRAVVLIPRRCVIVFHFQKVFSVLLFDSLRAIRGS